MLGPGFDSLNYSKTFNTDVKLYVSALFQHSNCLQRKTMNATQRKMVSSIEMV